MSDAKAAAKAVFLDALDRPRREEMLRFLDEACGSDPTLRARVEELLRAHEDAGSFLEPPDIGLITTVDEAHGIERPVSERPDTSIGPYKLLEQIGEGGFGVVFMAEQTKPVRRKVALKVLKPGMDTRQVVARFEAERQALAIMDHPNIARVYDGGATETGRPYFVMELVKGVPITEFCDQNHLTPRQRLELFIPVCQAVQHAHQKGIIHRDLKPSNVLVTVSDTAPAVKVIDFGIAKALSQELTDKTLFTGAAQMIGTPLYMSPEQAGQNSLDIDTRSDIYSLGVLLYELLTATTPFTKERFHQAGYDDIRRIIREEQPPTPSTRLSESKDSLPTISAQRQMEPAKLTKVVRGELDWIVMKALEKDRNRRYETANGFAMDVQRYLADEPVLACPPSVGYRLRKFVRRNLGPVVAASLVALALVGGVIGTTVGLVQAKRAKDTAEKRLAQIEKGIDLLGLMFEDLDPFAEEKEGRPLRAILGDRLDRAAVELEGEAVGDPLVVAKLQDRLGQTYRGLGNAAKAESLFTKAVAIRQAHLGADHPLTLASRHNQALAYERAGKRIEAIERFEQVHDARVKVLGADHLDSLSTLNELATAYWLAGKLAKAIPLLEQVRDGRVKQLGEDHDHTLDTLQNLSGAYTTAGKHPEAIALAEQLRDARVKKHGDDHPHAINALEHLANAYQAGYKMRAALDLYNQAQDVTLLKLGPFHPLTLRIQYGLAHMYRVYRKTPEAIALFEPLRERQVMILGGYHPATLVTLNGLALAYMDAGEPAKALPLFQQAAVGVEKLAYAHDEAERFFGNLARCHEQLRQYDQAETWRRKWLAVAKGKYGPESLEYAGVRGLAGLGSNLVQQKMYAGAAPILGESLDILQKNFPEGWHTFRAQSLLGAALLGQQKYADAELHLVQGYQGMTKLAKSKGHTNHSPLDRQDLIEALERLIQLYEATNKQDDATKGRKELDAFHRETEALKKPKGK